MRVVRRAQTITITQGEREGGFSSWGPSEGPTPEKVEVEMRNGFSPIGAIIDDKAVASFIEAGLAGYALSRGEKVGKE